MAKDEQSYKRIAGWRYASPGVSITTCSNARQVYREDARSDEAERTLSRAHGWRLERLPILVQGPLQGGTLLLVFITVIYSWCAAYAHPREGRSVAVPYGALVDYSGPVEAAASKAAQAHIAADTPTDKDGVLLVNYGGSLGLQYNPVSIANEAQALFYKYQRTHDQSVRARFLAQIRWLTKNAKPVGPRMAAYGFTFQWGELKPGWHSGLAQAQAIGALIRAYYMTKDASLLPLIRELQNFLFLPIAHGGVMSLTPEGRIWIEEFPFEKPGYVLNGFISAVFALYEYVKLFPDDQRAAEMYRKCLVSLRRSIPFYDTGHWHSVDRHGAPANGNYVTAHSEQLRWLYRLTGDAFYNYVRMRWLGFNLERASFQRGNVVRNMFGRYSVGPEDSSSRIPLRMADIERYRTSPVIDGFGLEQILDSNPSTYFAPLDADVSEKKPQFIEFRLKQPTTATALTLTLYNPELFPLKIRILARSHDGDAWRELSFYASNKATRVEFRYRLEPTVVRELRVECLDAAGQKRFVIAELGLERSSGSVEYPEIGSYISDVFEIGSPQFRVGLTRYDIDAGDIMVQYRCARSFDTVQSLPWVFDFLPPEDGKAVKPAGRFCQLSVVYTRRNRFAAWSDLMIIR